MEIKQQIAAMQLYLEKQGVSGGKRTGVRLTRGAGLYRIKQELDILNLLLEKQEAQQADASREINEELVKANRRLSLLIQNLQFAVLLEDENRRIVLANKMFCDVFRIPHAPDTLSGVDCAALADQSKNFFRDSRQFMERIDYLLEEKVAVLGDELHTTTGRTLKRDYIPIWNNGKYQGHLWVFNDITEKYAAERKLREQRSFYEDILNKIPAELAVFDKEHRYLFVNPVSIGNINVREWVIGRTNEEYFRLRGKDMKVAALRKEAFSKAVNERKEQQWEERLIDKDGSVKYYLRKLYPVADEQDNIKTVIGYGLDITERKQFEQQIQRSEKRYRDLFNYSQAIICTHDLEGRLISINPSLIRLLHYSEEEMLGHSIGEFVPEEDKPHFKTRYIDLILAEGKAEGVFCVLNREGDKLYLLYQNYKLDEPGAEPYIISFAQDITERVQAERALKLAKQMTEETARAKEAFLANMSHEIRTPMNGILGIASLLGKTSMDEQQRKYLRLIQESANNLLVIVNDVLDLEKIIAGKLEFEHTAFSLKERVEMCIQSFTFKAEEKGLAVQYQNDVPDDHLMGGDPYRLSQILNNLLSNAIKFTEEGVVTVSTHVKQQKMSRMWVEFKVTDSGIGIAPERLNDIFEPFVQANNAISRKYGGTGLGLSICRELIQLMGGKLEVISEENKGTTFKFILPFEISSVKPKNVEVSNEINYNSLGPRRVLLAEDVELNQYLARHIMESWGFEVSVANNGREALAMVEEDDFDLVLMDIQMPEMDGMEATRQIRALPDSKKSQVTIVALTANALKGDSEKYISIGMNDYLAKPFDEEKLFTVIARNLSPLAQNLPMTDINSTPNASGAPVIPPSGSEPLYDLSMVKSISNGDEGFITKMLQLLMETMPPSLDELKNQEQAGNWEMVGKLAHKMKSTIDSLGIKSLKEEIRQLEANGKQGLSETIPCQVNHVIEVMNRCLEQIKKDYQL